MLWANYNNKKQVATTSVSHYSQISYGYVKLFINRIALENLCIIKKINSNALEDYDALIYGLFRENHVNIL